MTLREYLDKLNTQVDEHPESLDMQVLYSIDDEGNAYHPVHFGPTLGFYEDIEFETEEIKPSDYNAVCIN